MITSPVQFQDYNTVWLFQVSLYDRHIHALNKVTKHYKNAFLLKDLVELFKILNICADRVGENEEVYQTPLLEILKICAKPFMKERASDENTYEQIAIESISQLGMYIYAMLMLDVNWTPSRSDSLTYED